MTNLEGQRVLVTGAAGCVGANLVRRLLELRNDVHAIVRPTSATWRIAEIIPKLNLHSADLVDGAEVRRIVADVQPVAVFHCAVARHKDLAALINGNVVATNNLLNATASRNDLRFVHLGSSLEYGPSEHAKHEDDLLRPNVPYGFSKAAATQLAQQAARNHGRHVVVLRLFHVYGPFESPSRLIPTAINAALCDRELALTASEFRRDCIYVGDVVDACLRAACCNGVAGEIINVGSGKETSNQELVQRVGQLTGRPIRIRAGAYSPRETDTHRWRADITKAKMLLDWQPQQTLTSGLQETIARIREVSRIHESSSC